LNHAVPASVANELDALKGKFKDGSLKIAVNREDAHGGI
jgi:hypothetical protein